MKKVLVELSEVSLDFLIKYKSTALVWSVFDRSQTNLRRACIQLSYSKGEVDDKSYSMGRVQNDEFPDRYIETFTSGRDLVASGLVVNSRLNKEFIITTKEKLKEDMYSFLMNTYDLPILKGWVDYIVQTALQHKILDFAYKPVVYSNKNVVIDFGYGRLSPEEIIVVRISLTEAFLKHIISTGLKKGDIYITHNAVIPLSFKTLDEYYSRYGANIVSNLTHLIKPLSEVNGFAKNAATRTKRLFPAQGNGVNGLVERLKRSNYAILNMDMGTGKTLQALTAMDAYFNTLSIEKTGKTLKNIMLDEDVSYKAAVICPGHLVDKWCSEAREIYGMKAKAIRSLSEIVDINNNRSRYLKGKWLFVFSKDFAKLSDMQGPIPSKFLRNKELKFQYCADCFREKRIYVYKQFGEVKCPDCESRKYKKRVIERRMSGLICPECGELLLKNVNNVTEYKVPSTLTYEDFRTKKTSNLKCYHCGASLWGSQVTNINATHKPNWVRVSYYGNKSHKTKNSCWVHKSQLDKFGIDNQLDQEEYGLNRSSTGHRRYSPARYIEKHMKNFFDFLIADECHLYESGTAQSQAFSSLVNASKKTLALTGTLTNGYSKGLFYMFWRLDPKKMVNEGYSYSSEGEKMWNEKYGVLESRIRKKDDSIYNTTSYGKSVGSFKLKPGVSPQITKDFLLESAVQLQISELSEGLPQLEEKIVSVETEEIVLKNLREISMKLESFANENEYPAINMVKLQFQLFYADHPYGVPAIKNPIEKGKIILDMKEFDCSFLISDGKLLNKEKKLLEIIEKELREQRRCYVFVESTGRNGDFFILDRIKEIVSRIDGAKPLIMEANTVSASNREKWLRKQVEDNDYNVIISNPRLVETGIDFIWNKNGINYNIPTIIFYQVGYRLDTLWQASRRHYRLTQKEDCRTYYLESEDTMQLDVLSLMAEKQIAVSAIQGGEFSSRGLASMAKGIDPKIELARRLREGQHASVEEVEKMFKTITISGKKEWNGIKNNLISEIIGKSESKKTTCMEKTVSKKTLISNVSFDDWSVSEELKKLFAEPQEKKGRKKQNKNQMGFFDLFE